MAEKKKYTLMNTVAVLSVSTLLYLATINASSLAYMVKEFPQYDVTTVKLFSTIPSLMMIVCSLMSGKLIQIFPIKKIVIGCACIMFAAGFGTYFVFNLPAILGGMPSGAICLQSRLHSWYSFSAPPMNRSKRNAPRQMPEKKSIPERPSMFSYLPYFLTHV